MAKKMTSEEKHYWDLSEVYLAEYEDHTDHYARVLQAMGVIVEMESDLAEFLTKGKPTEKTNRQRKRLDILCAAVNSFTVASERGLQFKKVMHKLFAREHEQLLRITELEKEVIKLQKTLQDL
ncbi:hypothetical protein [Pedobacter duraquae]|uniref:Uncharacterized protein n=1 Tax=Pedobacter duraquae TaxID=425511 RepID=A0A4R6IIV9_9SPHI|nr:hypothetical protein [Pedobacter duraquae]TDO21924.1 hypothetical protein CLV32_3032 [Pedobacter duraquae]